MFSGQEEGNESVGNVLSGELEVVAFNLNVLNFARIGEGFESEDIVVVPVTLRERLDLFQFVEFLEPLRLFGVDHSVLVEHDVHEAVEGSEASLDRGFVGVFSSLVVEEA